MYFDCEPVLHNRSIYDFYLMLNSCSFYHRKLNLHSGRRHVLGEATRYVLPIVDKMTCCVPVGGSMNNEQFFCVYGR